MLFDLFYELSVPPFGGRTESQVFHETLDELVLADRLGFGTAWLVEHHFMPAYSHSAAPDLFLAAAAQRTRQLRLGHGIVPLPYHHPVQVAERIATLDILSGGRVEFGFGRGFSPREYHTFGVTMEDSRSLTEEALSILRGAFRGGPLTFHGRHFTIDSLDIVPQVVQRPHPPLWTAAVSPDSFELAARLGVGVLVGPFKPWFMVREDIRRYRRHWQHYRGSGPPSPGENPRVAMTVGIFCMEDGRHARALAAEGITWFYRALLEQTRGVLERLYGSYEYYRRMGRLRGLLDRAVSLPILEALGMVVVGNPEHCVQRLRTLEQAGVNRVLLAVGAGALPTAPVQTCLELIAARVMPQFLPTPGDTATDPSGQGP
ncbi:MAG: monooxygenase [Chromatiales bacterium 21-64-14]|nr:MAG: monooxygenase [Chromatiales bacterium 21-64-14]HQU14939.1 LLM class flavin-dependent oxidoreductase [Gammaproteobacteria bacterium]